MIQKVESCGSGSDAGVCSGDELLGVTITKYKIYFCFIFHNT